MNRTIGAAVVVAAGVFAEAAEADLLWFTDADPNSVINSFGTALDASANDPMTGDFLQLILSPSGTISPAVTYAINPTGVSGDNLVVDVSFFGSNTQLGGLDEPIDGMKQITDNAGSWADGSAFFVRAWSEPASFYSEPPRDPFDHVATGEISQSPGLFYGDSAIFVYDTGVPTDNFFSFDTHGNRNTGWAANTAVIPEPSSIIMLLIGMGLLGSCRTARSRR
jgi:hypothetical protein